MGTGINKNVGLVEAATITLYEVSEKGIEFGSANKAGMFLGIAYQTLDSYASAGRKIIKSKVNGKTYLIRKTKTA